MSTPRTRGRTWFERLTGVQEVSGSHVRANITVEGEWMTSKANHQSWRHGRLEIPSLADLQQRVATLQEPSPSTTTATTSTSSTSVQLLQADVKHLHQEPTVSEGSLFQVASQFNLLEMVHPAITPDDGIGGYENDRTQGPICAIAAGPGTIFRQYFVDLTDDEENREIGQTADRQVDCLADMATILAEMSGNPSARFWSMRNGYALISEQQLAAINDLLEKAREVDRDRLRKALRVGIQWDTQVTTSGSATHYVSQIYCSALPVSYCGHGSVSGNFRPFALLILEAAYEATILSSIINTANQRQAKKQRSNNNDDECDEKEGNGNIVYLTLLGGGAFGNEIEWICSAIRRALRLHAAKGLHVVIVTYRSGPSEKQALTEIVDEWAVEAKVELM